MLCWGIKIIRAETMISWYQLYIIQFHRAENVLIDTLSEFNYYSPPPPPPPQELQSVVDHGFQHNRPSLLTVSGHCLLIFYSNYILQ
jgi:hypothetical protein